LGHQLTASENSEALKLIEALRDPRLRQQLRMKREIAGLSQMEVARRMNISHSTLSLFENGLGDLHPEVFLRLGKLLESELRKVERAYEKRVEYGYESAASKDGVPERTSLRKRADMSQSELSKNSRISQSRISLWETGRVELTKEELVRWELALRSGMERAIAKKALVEREILKDEKRDTQERLARVAVEVGDLNQGYKEQITLLQKQLSAEREAYDIEIKRLKKENAELRRTAKSKK
jgi:transcriptional regulator with XRE-family HTH domain